MKWVGASITAAAVLAGSCAGAQELTNTAAQARAYIAQAMASQHLAAVSVALVASQDVVWAEAFGWEDLAAGKAAATDTVFRVGSVSKALTGAAALKLAEEGRIDLDAAYTNYLPGMVLRPRFDPYAPTVRDLLCHHAGVPGDFLNLAFATAPWADFTDWLAQALGQTYPFLPAGFRDNYSNNGFVMAAAVVAAMNGDGLSFPAYCQSRLFAPLGMTASSFLKDRAAISNRLAKVYFYDGATADYVEYPEEFVNVHGTGGAYSTPTELAQFLKMILADGLGPTGRVLAAESVAAMLAQPYAGLPLDVDTGARSGLGWDCVENPRLAYAGKASFKTGSTYTHTGYIEVLPSRGVAVAVCGIGYVASGLFDVGDRILELAIEEKDGLPPPDPVEPPYSPVVTNLDPAALADVAGIYAKESGYDRFEVQGHALAWYLDAHLDETTAPLLELWPRENGWFSPTNTQRIEFRFTNLSGRSVAVLRNVAANGRYFEQVLHGEKISAAISPDAWTAWSNRIGATWLALDALPEDYLRVLGLPAAARFSSKDGLLLLRDMVGHAVALAPTNDSLAFVQGLNARCASSAECFETNGEERLRFAGYVYRRAGAETALVANCEFHADVEAGHVAPWLPVALRTGGVFTVTLTNAPANFRIALNAPDGSLLQVSESNRLDVARPAFTNGWLQIYPGLSGPLSGSADGAFRYPLRMANAAWNGGGMDLTWQSQTGRFYRILAAPTLTDGAAFGPVVTGIPGQPDFTTWPAPTSATAKAFYRIHEE